ncbi:hypothetical protein [Burkholderia ubonensis]|uniref:hypothetical protein n=1 Tax=Burkholderia ubonensis TaxID=101571 RepID=UPI0012F81D86|nr:hypothetical protein [Burkholderia ubonensis]
MTESTPSRWRMPTWFSDVPADEILNNQSVLPGTLDAGNARREACDDKHMQATLSRSMPVHQIGKRRAI